MCIYSFVTDQCKHGTTQFTSQLHSATSRSGHVWPSRSGEPTDWKHELCCTLRFGELRRSDKNVVSILYELPILRVSAREQNSVHGKASATVT
jgi:hypothetical protein